MRTPNFPRYDGDCVAFNAPTPECNRSGAASTIDDDRLAKARSRLASVLS